jgi:hypothetical protein
MSDKAESFVEFARKNLAAAKLIRTSNPGNAAFHLQQTGEKLAKAVLTIEEIVFGAGHQIGALAGALPSDNVFRPDLASFASAATPRQRAILSRATGCRARRRRNSSTRASRKSRVLLTRSPTTVEGARSRRDQNRFHSPCAMSDHLLRKAPKQTATFIFSMRSVRSTTLLSFPACTPSPSPFGLKRGRQYVCVAYHGLASVTAEPKENI